MGRETRGGEVGEETSVHGGLEIYNGIQRYIVRHIYGYTALYSMKYIRGPGDIQRYTALYSTTYIRVYSVI